jgi:hypothetical protein
MKKHRNIPEEAIFALQDESSHFRKDFATDGADRTDKGRRFRANALQYKFPIREIREIRGSSPLVAALPP